MITPIFIYCLKKKIKARLALECELWDQWWANLLLLHWLVPKIINKLKKKRGRQKSFHEIKAEEKRRPGRSCLPKEVEVDGGVLGLDEGPETRAEMRCLSGERNKRLITIVSLSQASAMCRQIFLKALQSSNSSSSKTLASTLLCKFLFDKCASI